MALLPDRAYDTSTVLPHFGRRPLRLAPVAAAKKGAQVHRFNLRHVYSFHQSTFSSRVTNFMYAAATKAQEAKGLPAEGR